MFMSAAARALLAYAMLHSQDRCCYHRGPLIEATLEEVREAHEDCRAEVQRMLQLHHDYTADEDAVDICYHCQEEGQAVQKKQKTKFYTFRRSNE